MHKYLYLKSKYTSINRFRLKFFNGVILILVLFCLSLYNQLGLESVCEENE